ncbi:MAG: DUF4364 family protein [Oscillospiraceae bacterium]|jgi:hypothetical protein|nr:DUF4364 family protein [Oscillospiraceae bacterium]
MSRYGFSGTPEDTRLLILYILRDCPGSITPQELQNAAMTDENADYFVYSEALADLADKGLIVLGEDGYTATQTARKHADATASELPASLRRKLSDELAPVYRRILRDSAITARTEQTGRGYHARLTLSGANETLADITLAAGSEEQAAALASAWKQRAESVYAALLKALLDD